MERMPLGTAVLYLSRLPHLPQSCWHYDLRNWRSQPGPGVQHLVVSTIECHSFLDATSGRHMEWLA